MSEKTPDFVTKHDWGISIETPFGVVNRTYSELDEIEKEVGEIDFESITSSEKRDSHDMSALDIANFFLHNGGTVDREGVKALTSLKKAWEGELKEILNKKPVLEARVRKLRRLKMKEKKDLELTLNMLYVDFPADLMREKITRVDRVLALLTKPNKKGAMDMNKAKMYPITSLIKVNKAGFARCVWHDEKTPSMKYYPKTNHVYCFGCHRRGDAIDVVQAIRGCSFGEAVDQLS